MRAPFRFKEFCVSDEQCGMKITTDAVLLGAFAEVTNAKQIIDIGSGSGIVALMMAQKSNASVDAIEIDAGAAEQAKNNFYKSKWANRLLLIHDSVQHYAATSTQVYDCIVCNPPYFHNQLKSNRQSKNTTKHDLTLNFMDLSCCVKKLLADAGRFWVIIPASEKQNFLNIFIASGLFCNQIFAISDKPKKKAARFVICLSKQIPSKTEMVDFVIKNSDNSFSDEFIHLTKNFYLNF
ncbi:MAG: methyltransferase [Bacteroidota bacterium]